MEQKSVYFHISKLFVPYVVQAALNVKLHHLFRRK